MRQKVDVVFTEECLGNTCCVGARIILLEKEVSMPLEKWHHLRLEHLGDIPGSIDPISTTLTHILKDNRANSLIKTNGAPRHDACTSPSVVTLDVGVSKALSGSPPDLDAAIDVVDAEPFLVREEDPPPVPKTPVDVLLGPSQTVAAVLKSEGRTLCWNAIHQGCCSQSPAHCSLADNPPMHPDSVSGGVSGSFVWIAVMAATQQAVLSWCGHPRSAAPGKVVRAVGGVESMLKSINCNNMHTTCSCDLLWRLTSMETSKGLLPMFC